MPPPTRVYSFISGISEYLVTFYDEEDFADIIKNLKMGRLSYMIQCILDDPVKSQGSLKVEEGSRKRLDYMEGDSDVMWEKQFVFAAFKYRVGSSNRGMLSASCT